MLSTLKIELAFAHEVWKKTFEWRVIAAPKSSSQLIHQVLFGGETAEKRNEIEGWTAEGLDLFEELLPESLTAPGWVFSLQIRGRKDTSGDWETVSMLRPLRAEQRFNPVQAVRELNSLIDDGASFFGRDRDAEERTEFYRDARAAYREITQIATEGHPSPRTRRIFSHI